MKIGYFDNAIIVRELRDNIKDQAIRTVKRRLRRRVRKDAIDELCVEQIVRKTMDDTSVRHDEALAVICYYGMAWNLLKGEPTDKTPWDCFGDYVIRSTTDELEEMGIEVLPAR